jgi:hypothetical protein
MIHRAEHVRWLWNLLVPMYTPYLYQTTPNSCLARIQPRPEILAPRIIPLSASLPVEALHAVESTEYSVRSNKRLASKRSAKRLFASTSTWRRGVDRMYHVAGSDSYATNSTFDLALYQLTAYPGCDNFIFAVLRTCRCILQCVCG